MKKILAIILAAVLVLSFAACKKNDTNNDTTAGDAQTSDQAADVSASDDTASSEEASSEVETEVVTDKEGHTVIETKASQSSDTKNTTKGSTTPSKGLNTNDAAACIKAYQAAIAKTKQFKNGRQSMSLKGSITADGQPRRSAQDSSEARCKRTQQELQGSYRYPRQALGHADEPHEERQRGDQRQLHHNYLQCQGSDSGREG